jgi:tripeptide aminopeptidase
MNNRLWETFATLTAIDSPSLGERAFCDALKARLAELGVETYEDDAGAQIGGNSGNLYGYDGGIGTPLLLSAHMDTVEPSCGKRAVLGTGGVITSGGDTILGADDVAGITVILETLTRLKERGKQHRPLELLFPVAEEKYGLGSAVADYSRIKSKEAYTLDLGGNIGEAANAAPTILSFAISVHGKASHAGFAPRDGVHAIGIAAKAIASLKLGEPAPGVTLNIGTISGGTQNNIVPDLCKVSGEIRSLDHNSALSQWYIVRAAFEQAAAEFSGSVTAEHKIEITAYETPRGSAVTRKFERACEQIGITPNIHATLGGSDDNNFALRGIEGLVIACSMHEVHSVREWCSLNEMEQCVQLLLALITTS